MTEELSCQLAMRTKWFDFVNAEPARICWRHLPRGDTPPRVPSPPWMFGSPSILLLTQRRWWEESCQDKPAWWEDPVPEVCCYIFLQLAALIQYDKKWSYEVHVPRALIGEYLAALKDSKEVVTRAASLLKSDEM